jgi:tetratricopeptide (TPR) repeat protein
MNRVEVAIKEARCVLVFGSRALADAETLGELRRRSNVPAVVLGGDTPAGIGRVDDTALAPALAREGGVICLVEADGADSVGLGQLAAAVQSAAHKPRLVVVARAFNPFALPAALRTLKFEHEKSKVRDFLFRLPVPAAPVAVAATAAPEPKKKSGAPRIAFVGREEELAWMAERTTGPVVVVGPPGIGKRWLVERALTGATNRAPDFALARGAEADSLYARIAGLGVDAGDKRLAEALQKPDQRPVPAALASLAVEVLANANVTLVIDRLELVLRRDGTFHRESRLELLLRALLTGRYGARVVFLSTIPPRFYREGEGADLPILELAGVKGKELHELFDAYRVEDFARDNFGPIAQRIHGHPLAARLFAVAVRDPAGRDELLESARFLAMENAGDIDPVRRRVEKAVKELTEEERRDLTLLAHFRLPFTLGEAEITGVKREARLNLLSKGLLDMIPDESRERMFYVHRLVQEQLANRETSLFDLMEALGDQYLAAAGSEKGQKFLALAQEGNRLLSEAHRVRNRRTMPFPDHDGPLEAIRGLVLSKKPRLDLAVQRIAEVLNADPRNTEVGLLRAALLIEKNSKAAEVGAVFKELAERAPTPEVFHLECNFAEKRGGGRNRAIDALERGVAAFPESGRLLRRLAGLLAEAGRLDRAVDVLKQAMALEPMMPDTYGLLGELYLRQGSEMWPAARDALAEARRLDPENTLHMARLGALMIETAAGDSAVLDEAQKLLEEAVQLDKKNYAAHLFLGRLLINRGGDLDRADWLLRNAAKVQEGASAPHVERARIAARKQLWPQAEATLEKAQKADPGDYHVFLARGEMFELRGMIFNAVPEFQKALERPVGAAARAQIDAAIERCTQLIASGAAQEMAKALENAEKIANGETGPRPQRDPGTTTKRRRNRGGRGRGGASAAAAEGAEASAEGGEGAEAGVETAAESGGGAAVEAEPAAPDAEASAAEDTGDQPTGA